MFIDAHAHLDMYEGSIEPVLAEIEERSILTLSNSLDLPSYRRNLEIAGRSRFVVPLFGIHPWSAADHLDRLDDIEDAVDRTPMLGEIGLDRRFVEDTSLYERQEEVFESLLADAHRLNKSVNLHTAGAEGDVLRLLDKHGVERAIVHWYSGPRDVFEAFAERGTYFTMGIGVSHSEHVRNLAAAVPNELLLTETDNPGGPQWLTGEPGASDLIVDVVAALAEIRNTTPEDIEQTVERNFARFVAADPHLYEACGDLLTGDPGTAGGSQEEAQ